MNITFDASRYPYKKEVLAFIEEWNSSSDYFEVKTSGTTGEPKCIRVKKTYAIQSAKATLRFFKIPKGGKAWLSMSPTTIAGKMMIIRSIIGELDLYVSTPSSSPVLPVDDIHLGAMVPMQVKNFIQSDYAKKVGVLLVGGAPISPVLWKDIVQSGVNAFQTFGSTETLSHIAARKIEDQKKPYQVIENYTIAVDQKNQLIINAPLIGVNNLRTNDIVQIEGKSHFYWMGRADFVINSGGVKLHPESIQEKLAGIISSNFFIASQPDERLGQKVVLVVEGSESSQFSYDFSAVLTKYEVPKSVLFCETFVRTESGKIDQIHTLKKCVE